MAIRALTLGTSGAPEGCLDCDSTLGLNFLWEPQFDSLLDFKVWLAAAGQIFFTLSVGMGTIHCYAAYVKPKDDIALNAMSAGWMNGFVEIVLGASIVIPIAVGYLGLDWVKENAGFSMAFQTMPYLFGKWGVALGTLAGVMWFGLLFFAGITSSLAMGTPWMGFMQDEFGYSVKKSALTFGLITLVMGLPTVFFFNEGVFDQYDYWGATVGIVIFALAESILFSWIFGIDRGWDEINSGSDITLPKIYKPIIKYVTPTILLVIFIGSLVTPKDNDYANAFKNGWELDEGSIIGRAMNMSRPYNRESFADHYEAQVDGVVELQQQDGSFAVIVHQTEAPDEVAAMYVFTEEGQAPLVQSGEVGAHLIFISTDFIFDGAAGPYAEEAAAAPLSVYGQSKADAEELVKKASCPWTIARTVLVIGYVPGLSRSNIILWARGALSRGERIRVVDDQVRSPTWSMDLAEGCLLIAEKAATGIYHLSGPDTMSILELVQHVAAHGGYDATLIDRVSSDTLGQPAKRPPITGFDISKAQKDLGYSPHSFAEVLDVIPYI
ncbi:MAG: NAD-dependent epimerase/dehydratase family protein [Flavobacteriia bacterium]|nr:NAD-dependent epimerase/dehydratase family protein [Flavobacteriia bacterium]